MACDGQLVLYDANGQEHRLNLTPQYNDLRNSFNDRTRSLCIPSGYSATAYRDANRDRNSKNFSYVVIVGQAWLREQNGRVYIDDGTPTSISVGAQGQDGISGIALDRAPPAYSDQRPYPDLNKVITLSLFDQGYKRIDVKLPAGCIERLIDYSELNGWGWNDRVMWFTVVTEGSPEFDPNVIVAFFPDAYGASNGRTISYSEDPGIRPWRKLSAPRSASSILIKRPSPPPAPVQAPPAPVQAQFTGISYEPPPPVQAPPPPVQAPPPQPVSPYYKCLNATDNKVYRQNDNGMLYRRVFPHDPQADPNTVTQVHSDCAGKKATVAKIPSGTSLRCENPDVGIMTGWMYRKTNDYISLCMTWKREKTRRRVKSCDFTGCLSGREVGDNDSNFVGIDEGRAKIVTASFQTGDVVMLKRRNYKFRTRFVIVKKSSEANPWCGSLILQVRHCF